MTCLVGIMERLKSTVEAYRSGHNGPHSKCGYRAIGTRVRIPSLPPLGNNTNLDFGFVLFFAVDYFGIIVERN